MSIHQPFGELLGDKAITISRHEAGDVILEYLNELAVDYVFGVPGGAIEPLFNALARSVGNNGPKAVIARHEAGSVFMADGYARESGKLGVCLATTGPGATNMLTGVASAYQDEIPMLVITGQPQLDQFGSHAVQESSCTGIDTVAMFKHCTAYSTLISHPDQLETKLVAAITAAYQHRRPVHLSIPLDIARGKYPSPANRQLLPPFIKRSHIIDVEMTRALCNQLRKASHAVFVIGEGCKDAMDDIVNYCEKTGASLVTTPQGKGLMNPYHPNFYGVCGLAGHETATRLLNSAETDLIVIVGSSLEQFAVCGWNPCDPNSRKIAHIDSNPDHFSRSQYAIINVLGNIKLVFEHLNKSNNISVSGASTSQHLNAAIDKKLIPFERRRLERRKRNSGVTEDQRHHERRTTLKIQTPFFRNFQLLDEKKCLNKSAPLKPQALMYELSRRTPDSTRFLADIGNSFLWAIHYLNPYHKPSQDNTNYLYMGMGFASMAWSVGAAIGVALAAPDKPVICIVGDGAMLMSAHELTVAVQCKLPIVYIVLNDQAYGTCKHGQKLAEAESIGAELPPVDFALYATSIGANGIKVTSFEDFDAIRFTELQTANTPTLIDVHINGTEPPPLSERLKMLASGRD